MPFEAAVDIVISLPGISRRTAEVIVAETGADMSRFPTPGQLCASAGVAPASYGVRGQGTARRAHPPRVPVAAPRPHRGCPGRGAHQRHGYYTRTQYARIAKRRGPNKAAVAVANSMLATIWHLLTNGALYEDLGADYFERRHDPAVEAKRLARDGSEALGYHVNPDREGRIVLPTQRQPQPQNPCTLRRARALPPGGHFTRKEAVEKIRRGCSRFWPGAHRRGGW